MDDDVVGYTPPSAPPTRTPSTVPIREDCWSEEATHTLVRAWGDRYLHLNRGHLRHTDWQAVADAVNAVHGHTKKSRRSDVQCKNRIDTLKKKYKLEKARASDDATGSYVSDWPFFSHLDHLVSPSHKPSPPVPLRRKTPPPLPRRRETPPAPELPNWTVPVGPRSKRPASAAASTIVRNFSAMAAAAAAAEAEEDGKEAAVEWKGGSEGEEWWRGLAEAIERVGEVYGRVEEAKQKQMVELEKQRMEFAKELEVQRMRIFMDAQIQMEKIRQGKRKRRSEDSDSYL